MYIDKKKAIKHEWRIKEKTLFILALLGGFIGSYIGMKTFRHKTKHKIFYIINIIALFIHIALWFVILK